MAGRTTTRQGASAKAGTTASSGKSSARRASSRASTAPSARVGTPRAAATKTAGARKSTAVRKSAQGRKPAAKAASKATSAARRKQAAALRIGGVPVLPVSIVVALVLLGWFMYPMARLHYQEQRKVERLQAQLTQIQQRNQRLKKDVERLRTVEGVEQAARELGLARKGEQLWVTMPEGGKPGSAPTTASPIRTAEVTPGLWTQVLDAVFGVGP